MAEAHAFQEDSVAEPLQSTDSPSVEPRRRDTATPIIERIKKGTVGESFRRLRANMMLAAELEPPQTVMVTSATAGEGKTLTCIGLAAACADAGDRTLLLDADLARPMVRRYLGLPTGSFDILDAMADPQGRFQETEVGSLHVLPAPDPDGEPHRLALDGLAALLHRLRSVYDQIVVDVPPITLVAETLLVARMVDGVMIVVDAESASKPAHRRLRKELEKAGIEPLGLVLNRSDAVDPMKPYYGYYQAH
jgi:protein-tyrosine kinase